MLAYTHDAQFWRCLPRLSGRAQSGFPRRQPPHFTHSLPRRAYTHIDGQLDAILHFAFPASPQDYLEMPIAMLKVGAFGTHKALGLAKAKGAVDTRIVRIFENLRSSDAPAR